MSFGSHFSPRTQTAKYPVLSTHVWVWLTRLRLTAIVAGDEVTCIALLATHPTGLPSSHEVQRYTP